MFTTFSSDEEETCSKGCGQELRWRQQLAATNSSYRLRPKTRHIRIAELDSVDELDSLIEDLKSIPGLTIERYLIPKEAYHVFALHPPPIGPDFPVATLEGEWKRPSGLNNRVFGLPGVTALLRELCVTAFAVTRKIKKASCPAPSKV